MTAAERLAWSPQEVADRLGLPYKSVLRLIRSGHLAAIQVGQRYIVPADAVERFLGTPERAS